MAAPFLVSKVVAVVGVTDTARVEVPVRWKVKGSPP
jgi:hypothetical protein